ncbi:MAG: recombinase family protein, partial [Candidatus Sedimenticola sp. (ex Thyasira tokunagai)]
YKDQVRMNIGYSRISKPNGAQCDDLQHDALIAAGVLKENIYSDSVSGRQEKRPGLDSCLKALREGDTLLVWKLDRLGRDLKHLVTTVQDLETRGVSFRVLIKPSVVAPRSLYRACDGVAKEHGRRAGQSTNCCSF